MRTKNSIKNTIVSFITNAVVILIGFISQAIFIRILGKEYLGINGLFSNIISMLGIAELGIGSAIIYNLYRPVAEDDHKKVNALLNLYKKCYAVIALVILILGLSLTPFLKFFVEEITIDINLKFVYALFIVEIVTSYLLSYKRCIINANQKNYLINLVHIGYLVLLNASQILILILTKNYYLYLVLKIIFRLLENIVINIVVDKLYPHLDDKNAKLDEATKKDIFVKVKSLVFHKIGGFIVMGTDNLIISRYIGIIAVGLYSNYSLIIDAVQKLFGQLIGVLTPSIGNLLVENNSEKNYDIFKKIRFLNFWIATFSGISLLIIMDSFITIWIGKDYLLPISVLIILVFNYYQKSMRTSYSVFKEAAGIYYEDRFVPIIESVLNIVSSIALLKLFGMAGVFMGTIISGLALWCYSYPKYVYKRLFKKDYASYIKGTLGYIVVFMLIAGLTYGVSHSVTFNNVYFEFISNTLIAISIPNLLLVLMFSKTDNFKYYRELVVNLLKR